MDKKQILLDSVKKLLALHVSDEEIVVNLKDVGIEENYAKQLLREAKGLPAAAEKTAAKEPSHPKLFEVPAEAKPKRYFEIEPEDAYRPKKQEEPSEEEAKPSEATGEEAGIEEAAEELPDTEEIAEDLFGKEEEEREKAEESAAEEETEPEEAPQELDIGAGKEPFKEAAAKEKPQVFVEKKPAASTDLWEKGILLTVSQALVEMRQIKKDLEKILDEKIQGEMKKETEKINTLLDSQRQLFLAKMGADLNAKAKEITLLVDDKIKKLEAMRQVDESLLKQMVQQLEELRKAKQKFAEESTTELQNARSAVQKVFDDAAAKLSEVETRTTKALEMQSIVSEAMAKEAKTKAEQLAMQKLDEIVSEVRKNTSFVSSFRQKMEQKAAKQKTK